jgi:curved DNA-binding protein
MKFKDYYQLLDIAANATDAEIKSGFRKQARKYHPDHNKEPGAEERFKDINEAHETLKDAKKRQAYDQLRASGIKPGEEIDEQRFGGFGGGGEGFSDIFESMFGGGFGGGGFGGGRPRPRKGEDIQTTLAVSLETAHKGGTQRISLSGPQGQRSLEVRIPAGIAPGKTIRLSGQGQASRSGGPAGDLLLTIDYQRHPQFDIEGKDTTFALRLKPWEAALGTRAQAQTLDGAIELNVPAGSNSGRKMRLRGRGFGVEGDRGDHYVLIEIENPSVESDEQRAAFEALAKAFA